MRFPIVLIAGGILGSITLALTKYLLDYVAIALIYLLGVIGWRFLVGLPRKTTFRLWVFFALAWAAVVCLAYADAFRQENNYHLGIWSCIGSGLGFITAVIGAIFYFTGEDRKRKD